MFWRHFAVHVTLPAVCCGSTIAAGNAADGSRTSLHKRPLLKLCSISKCACRPLGFNDVSVHCYLQCMAGKKGPMDLTCRAFALRGNRQWGRRRICQILQGLLWHLNWQTVALLHLRPGYPELTAYHFLLLRYLCADQLLDHCC